MQLLGKHFCLVHEIFVIHTILFLLERWVCGGVHDFCRNRAKVGRSSRALISKLVERKGEGAAAEGYRLHIRPLALTALRKLKSTVSYAESSLTITQRGFLGQTLLLTWIKEEMLYTPACVVVEAD